MWRMEVETKMKEVLLVVEVEEVEEVKDGGGGSGGCEEWRFRRR